MFELQENRKPESTKWVWVGALAIVALLVVAGLVYVALQRKIESTAPAAPAIQAVNVADAEPLRDLRATRAVLRKDLTGTMAMWLVDVQNRSTAFTYSDIEYETSYFGADGALLVSNQGTLEGSIRPGGGKTITELRDGLYPTGTVEYRFRLTGAKASVE